MTQAVPRQITRTFRATLPPLEKLDLQAIDSWLEDVLEVELDPLTPALRVENETESLGTAVAWRVLLLSRTLLQAVGVPVFYAGRVLRLEPDPQRPGQWLVALALAQVDQIPFSCYAQILKTVIELLPWVSEKPRSERNIQDLFRQLQNRVLDPLAGNAPASKSTIPFLQTAFQRNIPFIHLGIGVYQLGWGAKGRRLHGSGSDRDTGIGQKLSAHKVVSANLIRAAGLPAPSHLVVSGIEEAIRAARQFGWPVVIKPVDKDRGEGVVTDLADEQQLAAAFSSTLQVSDIGQVIIERQVQGVCHRLLIAEGQLLYAIKRNPKSIQGDGRSTISQLIQAANRTELGKPPWSRAEPCPADDLALKTLEKAGYRPDSVPADGAWIPLRPIESTAWGGQSEDVTAKIHPENVQAACKAAELFGLNVVGVDLITPDISVPWYENGAIINEVNATPRIGRSATSRASLPSFFDHFLPGDGRIPLEMFVGGDDAMAEARLRQERFVADGVRCYLTSHAVTCDPRGRNVPLQLADLYSRCRALLMDNDVEALIMVVQTDEFLDRDLPVDRIDRLSTVGSDVSNWRAWSEPVPQERAEALRSLLQSLLS